MKEILRLDDVKKYYGSENSVITKAIKGISFTIFEGELVAIMGASGSGKTTLLNLISTILDVTSGDIYIDGVNVAVSKEEELALFRREKLGFIFQDYNLLDTLTIEENMALSLIINKVKSEKIEKLVLDVAKKLNILDILKKFPYETSGGQRQRCAIGRALINHPKLILADEPTGALDSKSAREFLTTIEAVNQKLGSTILMVTHDAFSASFCRRVYFLRDGKIFNELVKGEMERKEFYDKILDVLTLLGGE